MFTFHLTLYTDAKLNIEGLQHKGTMSTKPVFEKSTEIQRSYIPLCGHTTYNIRAFDTDIHYDYY